MKFVTLTRCADNKKVYVNPEHVCFVLPFLLLMQKKCLFINLTIKRAGLAKQSA